MSAKEHKYKRYAANGTRAKNKARNLAREERKMLKARKRRARWLAKRQKAAA